MQNYQTIDGATIQVDKSQKHRMPHVNAGGVSYPGMGNLDGFIGVFQEEALKGRTAEMAKVVMKEFEPYLHSRDEQGKALFVATHSTPLFAPQDGSRPDPAKLGATYDELMNTYKILEQIVQG